MGLYKVTFELIAIKISRHFNFNAVNKILLCEWHRVRKHTIKRSQMPSVRRFFPTQTS